MRSAGDEGKDPAQPSACLGGRCVRPSGVQQTPGGRSVFKRASPGHITWFVEIPGVAEHQKHSDLYPESEPGVGDHLEPSRQARGPAHTCATTARRPPAGRNRLQAPAAYPGEVQRPSREAGAFAVKGIPSEPKAGRSEIGCSTLQP